MSPVSTLWAVTLCAWEHSAALVADGPGDRSGYSLPAPNRYAHQHENYTCDRHPERNSFSFESSLTSLRLKMAFFHLLGNGGCRPPQSVSLTLLEPTCGDTRERLGKSQPGDDLEVVFWPEIRLLRNLRNNKLRMIAMSISKCTNRA